MIECEENNKYNALNKLSSIVGHVFADCLTMFHGYPRGVITYGALHYSLDCIIGPALVKAYEMEQKDCLFPRIIVDEGVFTFNPSENLKLSTDKLYFRDIDGRAVLNSLACISREELNVLTPNLVNGLLNNFSNKICKKDPKVFIKYDWLVGYVTDYLSLMGLIKLPESKIRR